MSERCAPSPNRRYNAIVVALIVVYTIILVRTAWVCDDAYITFRVVDNFVHGYGLRWNVAERVQVFTHPLWLFMLVLLYAPAHEIYFTTVTLSLLISIVAITLVAFGTARTASNAVLAVLVLTLSRAFVDYSTSGLENPLSHLLLVLFALLFFRDGFSPSRCFFLSLVASLAMANRMDTALLYCPGLCYALWKSRNWHTVGVTAAGFVPFLGWELFSLLYYGFPFPNTYYAKLGAGISNGSLLGCGMSYLWDSLRRDPLTLSTCMAGLLAPLVFRRWSRAWFAAGGLLCVVYVVRIGGDYMSGRFLTAPLLVAVLVIAGLPLNGRRYFLPAAFGAVLALGLLTPSPTVLSRTNHSAESALQTARDELSARGCFDARSAECWATGLLHALRGAPMPDHPDRQKGLDLAAKHDRPVVFVAEAGFLPFFAGPQSYFLDLWCLGDPLRARLAVPATGKIAAGHLARPVPNGYPETLSTGKNCLSDKNLAEFSDHLSLVVRGPLFDPLRLKTVLWMNLGSYDHLIGR